MFQLYIISVLRLGYGDIFFVLKLVSDVLPIYGADMVDDILLSHPHMVCFPFLALIEDVVSKCTA